MTVFVFMPFTAARLKRRNAVTYCERYDEIHRTYRERFKATAVTEEQLEMSDEDIRFVLDHEDNCPNPEHRAATWEHPSLKWMRDNAMKRMRNVIDNLTREEHGIITEDSPHDWILAVLKEVEFTSDHLGDLIGRTYVFVYNDDDTNEAPEQCALVVGKITGVSASNYPKPEEKQETQVLYLASSEVRVRIKTHDGEALAQVVALQRCCDACIQYKKERRVWSLILMPDARDQCRFIAKFGTLRILNPAKAR